MSVVSEWPDAFAFILGLLAPLWTIGEFVLALDCLTLIPIIVRKPAGTQ